MDTMLLLMECREMDRHRHEGWDVTDGRTGPLCTVTGFIIGARFYFILMNNSEISDWKIHNCEAFVSFQFTTFGI